MEKLMTKQSTDYSNAISILK